MIQKINKKKKIVELQFRDWFLKSEKDFNNHIAEEVKKHRDLYNLTQTEFGEVLGVRQATVSDWENGKITLSCYDLYRISKIFREKGKK